MLPGWEGIIQELWEARCECAWFGGMLLDLLFWIRR